MTGDPPSATLQAALEQRCEKVRKPRFTVLFRRGDKASGMFVVLSELPRVAYAVAEIQKHSNGEVGDTRAVRAARVYLRALMSFLRCA